ncbi:MAG: hypothetical protein DCC75_13880, partial [Proteobacteria bacterium]
MIAVLIICGLVIDGGGLFRMYNNWKNTLDAGALAGGIALDSDPARDQNELQLSISNLISENLRQMSVPEPDISHAVNSLSFQFGNGTPRTLSVAGEIPQPTWLLGALPGFPDYSFVSARAEVQLERVMLSLVLDASGSMSKCIDSGPETNVGTISICQDPAKIRMNAVKENVKDLIDRLRPEDWVSITAFNTAAFLVSPMSQVDDVTPGNLAADRMALKAQVDQVQAGVPGPYTKIRDGLELGRRSITHSPPALQSNLRKILLLVTDGAPIESEDGPGTFSWPEYSTPSYTSNPLHPDNGIPWNSIDTTPAVIQNNDVVPALLGRSSPVICSTIEEYQGGSGEYDPLYAAPFYDPGYDSYKKTSTSHDQDTKNSQILSILQADMARQSGIQVFTIGIGDPDSNLGPNNPPNNCYQYSGPFQSWHEYALPSLCNTDVDQSLHEFPARKFHNVKQFLLQRIANDRTAFDSVKAAFYNNQPGLHEFPCVQSTAALANSP